MELLSVVYGLVALFIAWIWIHYFRMIDLFEREKLGPMLLSFLLGAASVLLIFWAESSIFAATTFDFNGQWFNDLSFIFLRIAGPEEFAKILAFGLSYLLLRKHFNEPLDYLIYCSLAALGFSALENFLYFRNHGAGLFVGRGILSTVGHMFDTALFAYGVILYRFRYQKRRFWLVPLFFILGVSAHTFYNFWLLFPAFRPYGYWITVLFFLFSISVYAVILNNALNQSSFFDYRKAIHSTRVSGYLLSYYGLLFLVQLAFVSWERDFFSAIVSFQAEFYLVGFVTLTSTIRLSHMQLIDKLWFPIRFELPFYVEPKGKSMWGSVRIRGYAYNASYLQAHFQEDILLRPMNRSKGPIHWVAVAKMEEILFFRNNRRAFKTKVWDAEEENFDYYLLVPKLKGKNFNEERRPIVGLIPWQDKFSNLAEHAEIDLNHIKVEEWLLVYSADWAS